MPTLEWIGKGKVINHHQEVPFRVLDRRYSFDESAQNAADNGSDVHGYLAENPFYSVDKLNEYIRKTEEAHYVSPFRAKAH